MTLEATPVNVGRLRRAARHWLASVLDDTEVVDTMTLAVSEAVENAVDHAFAGRAAGTVGVTGRVPGDCSCAVEFTVTDDGRWQRPGDPGSRGRGLAMIMNLCSAHSLVTDSVGTRVTMRHDC